MGSRVSERWHVMESRLLTAEVGIFFDSNAASSASPPFFELAFSNKSLPTEQN
jgi:hypothetical protein